MLEFLLGLALTGLILYITGKVGDWTRRDKPVESDPLLELAEAHRMELAVWDEQFSQLTGKSVVALLDPTSVQRARYLQEAAMNLYHVPGLRSALAQAQPCDNQYYQNQAAFAAMIRGQQQSQLGPQSLGGLLGGLGGLFGGIH